MQVCWEAVPLTWVFLPLKSCSVVWFDVHVLSALVSNSDKNEKIEEFWFSAFSRNHTPVAPGDLNTDIVCDREM